MSQQTGQPVSRDPVDVAIGRLVRLLMHEREEGGLSTGDCAELRRMDPLGPALPPALWRLLTLDDVDKAIGIVTAADRGTAERAFAIVIQAIAEIGDPGSKPVGRALAETGYAEARFVRLLRARGRGRDLEDVAFETRQAARWCAVKGAAIQVAGFCRFVLDAALDRKTAADERAHAIARDYFAAPKADAQGAAATET
jgi:hypothetical protein